MKNQVWAIVAAVWAIVAALVVALAARPGVHDPEVAEFTCSATHSTL